jgi:hypothetical protein
MRSIHSKIDELSSRSEVPGIRSITFRLAVVRARFQLEGGLSRACLTQGVNHPLKARDKARAQRLQNCNDHKCDERRKQSIFNCRSTGIIIDELDEQIAHADASASALNDMCTATSFDLLNSNATDSLSRTLFVNNNKVMLNMESGPA